MALETRIAESEDALEAIFRHRYEILCAGLKRDLEAGDHDARRLVEDVDTASRHVGAYLDGELIGSMRWVWGGDAPFTDTHEERYRLGELLAAVPASQIVIAEQIIVAPEHRDRNVISAMFAALMGFVSERRIQLVVGACQPHLLNLHAGLGFRTFSMVNIDHGEAGYVVPLVLIAEDVDYLRTIGSPIACNLRDFGDGALIPEAVAEIAPARSAVRSERLSADDEYWRALQSAYALSGLASLHLFDGLDDEEIQIIVKNSHLIECRAGDRVLKKRDIARNMYVVLSGSLEARDRDQYIATLMPGDIIGEIAFLLETPRTADVVAMLDGTRLLSLSETTVQDLIASHPGLAARFLLNVARLLCAKLAFRAM